MLADFFSFARTMRSQGKRKIDVVFLSPPWGGPSYIYGSPKKALANGVDALAGGIDDMEDAAGRTQGDYSLSSVLPVHGAELYALTREITPNVAFFLPKNTNLDEVSGLVNGAGEASAGAGKKREGAKGEERQDMIEVEEQYMGGKLKALVCYFGELAAR